MARETLFCFGLVAGLAAAASAATYTNEVAAGVTQTFAQWEAAKGFKLADGDTIVKKGPGVIQVESGRILKYNMIVEEGVFDHPNYKNTKTGGSITVKKGGCFYLHTSAVALDSWTYNIAGAGTGVSPYLGAVVSTSTAGSGQVNHGTWNLTDDATIFTKNNSNNFLWSGTGTTTGPTVNLNNHTLTVKGEGLGSMFRPRWYLALNNANTILVDNCFYARHASSGMDKYNPNIQCFKLVNGSRISVDGYYYAAVNAFDFEYGTSIGKTSAGGGTAMCNLRRIIGCPEITSDATITALDFAVRGADLAAGHYLRAANAFTFGKEGAACNLDVLDLADAGLQSGKVFTVAASDTAINGEPVLSEALQRYFTLTKTEKAVTLTVKDGFTDGGLLPGEENAAHNTAVLQSLSLADGTVLVLGTGDYYFDGDFDLSSQTARNVTITSLGGDVKVHATLKLGAMTNVAIDRVTFKDCAGPAVVANGTAGLVLDGCTLDSVVGAWTVGEEEKKVPFVFTNVTDLDVKTNIAYRPLQWMKWDAPALFDGGSQVADSQVRSGELVVYCPPDLKYRGDTAGWLYWTYVTHYFGLNDSAYNGLKLIKLGNGTLDVSTDIQALGIAAVEIRTGQYVARADNALGVAKSTVVVKDGACLCLAGSGKNIDQRTIQIEGDGVKADQRSVRFTGTSAWNKADTVTWELTGDATMYDNIGNAANGTFLYSTFKMNGHTLTLTGKSGGNYRFGRWCKWNGGGRMVVDGVTVGASAAVDSATTPDTTAFSARDKSRPQFVFRNKAVFGPDTCELAYLMSDIDFTSDCSITAKEGAKIPHNFVFKSFGGAPSVTDIVLSIQATDNYTAHAADFTAGKPLTMKGAFKFGEKATVTLDGTLPAKAPSTPIVLISAEGGIVGAKPTLDTAAKDAGWVLRFGGNRTQLLAGAQSGTMVIVR